MFVTKTRRIVIFYKSGISNLSDTLRKLIVFFSMEALTSTLRTLSPYKSRLVNLSSEKFDISPISSIILSRSVLRKRFKTVVLIQKRVFIKICSR